MVVKTPYISDSGDVVWVNLNPTRGHEQKGFRPVLVLSPKSYNSKTDLMLVCPITSQEKGYPFEVLVSTKKVTGVALVDQIRSIDWKVRGARFADKVSPATLARASALLKAIIAPQ